MDIHWATHFLEVGEVVKFAFVSDGKDKMIDNPEGDPRVAWAGECRRRQSPVRHLRPMLLCGLVKHQCQLLVVACCAPNKLIMAQPRSFVRVGVQPSQLLFGHVDFIRLVLIDADLAMPRLHGGNDEGRKAWKAIEPAFHPSLPSLKSPRDFNIPNRFDCGIHIPGLTPASRSSVPGQTNRINLSKRVIMYLYLHGIIYLYSRSTMNL